MISSNIIAFVNPSEEIFSSKLFLRYEWRHDYVLSLRVKYAARSSVIDLLRIMYNVLCVRRELFDKKIRFR